MSNEDYFLSTSSNDYMQQKKKRES
uniref:Uncharacterized protein n=1 Tax=Rhizophora mucronata TaxID=61149 RepID=A0A2P2JU62_RHIMU